MRNKRFWIVFAVAFLVWFAGNTAFGEAIEVTTGEGWFWSFMEPMLEGVKRALCWIAVEAVTLGTWLLGLILDALPSDWKVGVSGFMEYFGTAGAWINLPLMVSLAGYYFGVFLPVFVLVKLTLKLIPTIG